MGSSAGHGVDDGDTRRARTHRSGWRPCPPAHGVAARPALLGVVHRADGGDAARLVGAASARWLADVRLPGGWTLSPVSSGALRVEAGAGVSWINGVPYSANALVTEYHDRVNEANGDSWLIVKTIIHELIVSPLRHLSDSFRAPLVQSR